MLDQDGKQAQAVGVEYGIITMERWSGGVHLLSLAAEWVLMRRNPWAAGLVADSCSKLHV